MNTKFSCRIFLALSALLLAALACGRGDGTPPAAEEPLPAAEQPDAAQAGDILFQDDFQDGQPDGWEITAAWYVQQSGDIYIFEAGGSGGAWVPQGGSWNNYAFESAARLDAGSLLLSFNLSQTGRYMVRLDEMGLYLVKEYPTKNYTVLAQTGPVSLGEWHQLDTRTYNGHIQVYVDDALWVDYSDSAPLSMGTIAITTQDGSRAAVDDVLVTKTGPLPSGNVQAPPALDVEMPADMGDEIVPSEISIEEPTEESPEAPPEEQPEEENTGSPDLVVLDATFEPDPVIVGQPFTANYVIQNQGDAATGAFTLLWEFHDALGVGVCSWDYDTLAAGESVWGGCTKTTNADPGQAPTILTVDIENEVAESDESNNELAPTITVAAADGGGQAELPDLWIGAMAYTDHNFRCVLGNSGQGTALAGVRVTLFVNGNKFDWQETATPLPHANSITFNFPVDLDLEELNQARCIADRGNSVEEENDDNNEFVWMPE